MAASLNGRASHSSLTGCRFDSCRRQPASKIESRRTLSRTCYMEKVLSRVCHDSWRKSENKMSSKINQAELAFVQILGVCPRLEPKARVGNHAAREGKATTQKIVIATQATTMR